MTRMVMAIASLVLLVAPALGATDGHASNESKQALLELASASLGVASDSSVTSELAQLGEAGPFSDTPRGPSGWVFTWPDLRIRDAGLDCEMLLTISVTIDGSTGSLVSAAIEPKDESPNDAEAIRRAEERLVRDNWSILRHVSAPLQSTVLDAVQGMWACTGRHSRPLASTRIVFYPRRIRFPYSLGDGRIPSRDAWLIHLQGAHPRHGTSPWPALTEDPGFTESVLALDGGDCGILRMIYVQ